MRRVHDVPYLVITQSRPRPMPGKQVNFSSFFLSLPQTLRETRAVEPRQGPVYNALHCQFVLKLATLSALSSMDQTEYTVSHATI